MRGLGTLINTATVIAGGGVGVLVGHRSPEAVRTVVVQVIGMVTLVMGVDYVLQSHNLVFPLVGTVVGAVIGEALRLERRLERLGAWLKRRFTRSGEESRFVAGFVPATLLFC
ncbi:MAG: DUF554 family protein, partial [Ilumatobacteraceae bacterium]